MTAPSDGVATLEPGGFYALRRPEEVLCYLRVNPFLLPLLVEAQDPIHKHFPQVTPFLDVVTDPEATEDSELVVSVPTALPPEEAMDRLAEFDRDWWLSALPRARAKLCITLEFR